ncbi:MAG: radical SAM protein, partial [Lachnospiraceae bacterium]|nr:radical SAM protein [Lachnospiraceae bacterium]
IPFCKSLCSFCEYTKFLNNDSEQQQKYITLLKKQIENFTNTHKIEELYGLDIGGGTPTSLSDECLEELMDFISNLEKRYIKIHDYEKSIEINFNTISDRKLEAIKNAGFKRVSAGLQIMNKQILSENNRDYASIKYILNMVDKIRERNIKKINLDLMYGLKNQTNDNILNTIAAIKLINPEQVTLYEMRYNIVGGKTENITRELVYSQYSQLYSSLIDLGYKGRFGSNTFSKFDDLGLSSYLKYRMVDCIPYKGFGISAQSMSLSGISYNIGKNKKDFNSIIENNNIFEEDVYKLPKEEILSKYIAVSLYGGCFKIDVMNKILNCNALEYFKNEFDFLLGNDYIYIEDNICYLTQNGFKYYGAIVSLFYSQSHKKYLLEN